MHVDIIVAIEVCAAAAGHDHCCICHQTTFYRTFAFSARPLFMIAIDMYVGRRTALARFTRTV